ncbi:MAG: hypothetical protein KGN33_16200 [Paracoccaceae bacterium]|nr:hypothetical protein [Paracoccaceae bacterium]
MTPLANAAWRAWLALGCRLADVSTCPPFDIRSFGTGTASQDRMAPEAIA